MAKDSEISVVTFFWVAWDQKWLVLSLALVFGIIATVLAVTATPLYKSQVIVTQVHDTTMGGSGGLMNQLGGLASIAGLNINGGDHEAERAAVLNSRELVNEFVKRYNLTAELNGDKKGLGEWDAVEKFKRIVLDIHEEKLKETTTITVEWKDPAVAAQWANEFVALANEQLRNRAIQESTRNIDYLNKQSQKTADVEMQHAIFDLIEHETKTLMLANGRTEYAFTVIDPAVPAHIRSSPHRTVMVLSGLFIGGFLGSVIAWVRKSMRRREPTAAS
ncbi:MAG TPA: Wzz/FepE/Etk N-terminal domain-containing protein [Steroidobacteraceae bacterium]|jgi:uncharacterized protein involved in exopolysaccharide biosynthesis